MLCVAYSDRLERETRSTVNSNTMPTDYSAYLLSASPPGFDLAYTLRRERFMSPRVKTRTCQNDQPGIIYSNSTDSFCNDDDYNDMTEGIASLLQEFQSKKSNSLPIAYTGFRSHRELTQNKNQNNSNSDSGLKKKTVSFADDLGQSLVEVRIVYESSDEPPTFSMPSEILSTLAEGAQAGITESPPLVLNFAQPASNYMAFRDKIEQGCVSLENVIVKEYHLLGTVKVKNIAFEKKVVVRYTCDSWATVCDVDATYVPTVSAAPGPSAGSSYDTFSFQLNIPPTFNPNLKIQFSVMYETNGQQFWDNNDGNNYEVVSANNQKPQEKSQDNGVFDLHHDDRWTEFSNWSCVDNSIPYW